MFQTQFLEKIKVHILGPVTLFENCGIYEIMSKKIVEPGKPQLKIWCMRQACWAPKATNTYSEYVIVIAFALEQ